MRYYPILVNLTRMSCLVVGAGRVGLRKVQSLLDAEAASVLVVDPSPPSPEMEALLSNSTLAYAQRPFSPADLDGQWLVIAATSNPEINADIARLCAEQHIFCNVVDQPAQCSFIVPATINRGGLTLAVSTNGQSPALSRKIRQDLQDSFGVEYGLLLQFMGRLRPALLQLARPSSENSSVFRAVVGSDLLNCLERKDMESAVRILNSVLPPELHPNIPELLDGII